jgi:KDO2-lipid IV(A) lauroyltransferase
MWYHWGCVAAEYSHLAYFIDHPHLITVSGQEVVEELIRDQKPALVFSAHWGNFQMIPIVAARLGLPLVQFYRAPNHPGVAERFRTLIQPSVEKIITKGPVGTRQLLHAFAQGSHLFMLLDQYAQDGLMLPFLGRASATVLAPAALCRKFHCPLVPARAERTGPMQFHVTFYPPLAENKSDEARMMQVNDLMSSWITQRPEQWFWIHKRWKTPFNPMKPYP